MCFLWLSSDNSIREKKSKWGGGVLQTVRGLACHPSQKRHHALLWGGTILCCGTTGPCRVASTHQMPVATPPPVVMWFSVHWSKRYPSMEGLGEIDLA